MSEVPLYKAKPHDQVPRLLPLLSLSAPFVVFSPSPQPLFALQEILIKVLPLSLQDILIKVLSLSLQEILIQVFPLSFQGILIKVLLFPSRKS